MKKSTLGMIVPAIALLGAAGTAHAAIDSDNAYSPTTGDGGGELFLSVIDRGGAIERSYVLDLGITAAEFLAGDSPTYSLSFAADANLLDILNNAQGTIAWNIAAAHNTTGPGDSTPDAFGFMTTSTVALNPFNVPSGFNGIASTLSKMGSYLQSVDGTDTDYAADVSWIFTSTANAFYDTSWGASWHGSPFSTETGLGGSLDFYFVAMDFAGDPSTQTSRADQAQGQWSLSADGLLTYSSAAAPVPLPAGVWLLGSALLGMAGIGRRRKTKAGELVAA